MMLIINILSNLTIENPIPYNRAEAFCRNFKSKNSQIFHYRQNDCKQAIEYDEFSYLDHILKETIRIENQ